MSADGHRLARDAERFFDEHERKLEIFLDSHGKRVEERQGVVQDRLAALEHEDSVLERVKTRLSDVQS